jgi:hypothetical protein
MSHFTHSKKLLSRPLIKLLVFAVGVLFIAQCVGFYMRWNTPLNQFRRTLKDRQEYRSETDEFVDHSQYITGCLPISRFQEIVELLDLSPHQVNENKPLSEWQTFSKPCWYLPTKFDEQYQQKNENSVILLGRSGDQVYYQWHSW